MGSTGGTGRCVGTGGGRCFGGQLGFLSPRKRASRSAAAASVLRLSAYLRMQARTQLRKDIIDLVLATDMKQVGRERNNHCVSMECACCVSGWVPCGGAWPLQHGCRSG